MYNLIPLILILISLFIIIIIIAKKFSILVNLDVNTIPSVKGTQFKERIVGSKIKRNFFKWTSRITKILNQIGVKIVQLSRQFYEKIYNQKEDLDKKLKYNDNETDEERINKLFLEIEHIGADGDMNKIEKILIKIIGIDSKNINAFEKLGDMYFSDKRYTEARETYKHILKLVDDEDIDKQANIYFDLSLVSKSDNKIDDAVENIKKAINLNPNNPRYLDTMFELSIMTKDKKTATTTYNKLFSVNPENKKLSSMKDELNNL